MDKKEVLTRGVEKVLPGKEGLAKLMGKRKIKLYLGIDPTAPRLHLGHTIPIRKLAQFAELGHEAILLFGTGTVLAGDPSQWEKAREKIAAEQINHNISTWKEQVKNIIDFAKVNIMYNGEWLLQLTLRDIIEIASHISAVQLFKRDMFQKRIARGDTIWTHEMLYPLLQGYDSVAMDVDAEIGGTDQEFNMLVGRELLQKMKGKEKYVITTPMITGLDGKTMSKSSGNCVWLTDTPGDMFGKLMSMRDEQIEPYTRLLTDLPEEEVMKPMEAKKKLAWEIVKTYHSEEAANKTQEEFERVFQKGKAPEEAPVYQATGKTVNLLEALTSTGLVESKSEARRLVEQGALEWNGEKVKEPAITVEDSGILRVGKYRFLRIEKK